MPGPALPAHIRALGLEHEACPFFLLKEAHIALRPDCLPVSFSVFIMSRKKIAAVAYLRTCSAANVGADKDSDKRQRATIAAFAKANGYVWSTSSTIRP